MKSKTISVSPETLDELVKRREHPRETYNDIVRKLMGLPVQVIKRGPKPGKKEDDELIMVPKSEVKRDDSPYTVHAES